MLEDVFKNKIPVYERLVDFGFVLEKGIYTYSCPIVDNQFILTVSVHSDGRVQVQVIDPLTQDEYTLHLAEGVVGAFVGKVRADYYRVLQEIAENCFDTKVFQSEYADKIISYIKQKYGNDFEYLWEKFPDNAVVRRADNQKWYAALLTVKRNKIGLSGDEIMEIIDLRMSPEEITRRVDKKRYFPGYHMNKKHWVTICLDGSVEAQEIFKRIDESYLLAQK